MMFPPKIFTFAGRSAAERACRDVEFTLSRGSSGMLLGWVYVFYCPKGQGHFRKFGDPRRGANFLPRDKLTSSIIQADEQLQTAAIKTG